MTGFFRPRQASTPGTDFAGVVEDVGRSVTRFKPGDAVFGGFRRAFAEYVVAPESGLAFKPANLTYGEAAALPVAGLTALQGLRDKAQVRSGQRVLVNGAVGGVGSFAVQIAKAFGADVSAVCSTRNLELARSIGADEVIDYTRHDFTVGGPRFHVIFDTIGNRKLSDMRRALAPGGRLVVAGGPSSGRWLGPIPYLVKVVLAARFVSYSLILYVAHVSHDDLDILRAMSERGQVRPLIDRGYPLDDAAEAIRYLKLGHARGKVLVAMQGHDQT